MVWALSMSFHLGMVAYLEIVVPTMVMSIVFTLLQSMVLT